MFLQMKSVTSTCSLCKVIKVRPFLKLYKYPSPNAHVIATSFSNQSHEKLATVQPPQEQEHNELLLTNHKKELLKKTRLKIKRPPFMKNLYKGEYDVNMLSYPEILDNKEIAALHQMSETVRRYVLGNVDSGNIDRDGHIPESNLDDLKKMGLFGSRVPEHYGGLGMSATEHVRLIEACSLDPSLIAVMNTHHSIAAELLLHSANDDLKNKYLTKIASGQSIAALCVTEALSGGDVSAINTIATKNKERTHYTLNGKKTWVTNGDIADLFIVLVKNCDIERANVEGDNFTTFLVEKDFPGVKIGEPTEKMGLKGATTCTVEFHDTPVSIENIIGNEDRGYEPILNVNLLSRFHIGAFAFGLSKSLIDLTIDHCINRKQFMQPLMNFSGIKDHIGQLVCQAYAMESVCYHTAFLFDSTEEPDLALECSAVKVFCTEGLWYCVNKAFAILGSEAYASGHPVERAVRDTLAWSLMDGSNEVIRQYITLVGIEHTKKVKGDRIEKLRNPSFNPMLNFSNLWLRFKHELGYVSSALDLAGYVHPTLKDHAKSLDMAVMKFHFIYEKMLIRHGRKILDEQVTLACISDLAIDIYVMTAVLSRASRSYCIGLPCSFLEIKLATAYFKGAIERNNRFHEAINKGSFFSENWDFQEIAKETFRKQGYSVTPTFTRNY